MDSIEKKIAEKYNKEHGGQPQQAPAQPAPQQPQQQQAPPPPPAEHHHHGGGIAKKLGNAAVWGAGATAGSDAVNSVLH